MSKSIAIIGLGYVGLPLACLCAKKGYDVIGIDKNPEIVKKVNEGISHIKDKKLEREVKKSKGKIFATRDFSKIKNVDIIIVCVPTPVNKKHKPDLEPLKSAAREISKFLKKGHLVIIESTIYPGTTGEIVKKILENSGLKSEKDFFLAHCPERIDPGNKKWNIENIPRVLGALSKRGRKKAAKFYREIINAEVKELSTVKAAEAVKIVENTFRDINIAFINELAKSFDKFEIDIKEVIEGAKTKPFGFMAFYPGCGVGGHCIPVDPYYLIEKAKNIGFNHKFLKLAREINNSMPQYTVSLLEQKVGNLKGKKIGVLGLAYKANVDDIRESPALKILEILKKKGADVFSFDPLVPEKSSVPSLDELLKKVNYLILATDHREFKRMNLRKLRENNIKVIIDGKNCLNKKKIQNLGIDYKGIGR
ncbi:MAG: nucleotide sugar dehydrogenase [Candidatus Altiarchaeota archaeon]